MGDDSGSDRPGSETSSKTGDARIGDGLIIVGIFLAVLAAALGTISKQLIAMSEFYKKPWLFHLGATINIAVGPVVDASAYAFAPQVIVAPFACLDVIFNALTAPYTLKWQNEVLTKAHMTGSGLVALGAVFTSVFADAENEVFSGPELQRQLLRPASIAYLSTELIAIIIVNVLLRRGMLNSRIRGVSLGVVAGVLMGNVFFMKGLIGFLRRGIEQGDWSAFLHWTPYVCAVCAVGGAVVGHLFMRKGLGEYKGVFMVTIFEGAHITAACLSGCIVMSEMSGAAWWRYLTYWASVLMIVTGILFINTKASDSKMQNKSFHIAQNFVDEAENENASLKCGAAAAPIGRALDDQEDLDLDMENPLDGSFSVKHKISANLSDDDKSDRDHRDRDRGISSGSAFREPNPAKPQKTDGDDESNVSTSTPEGDLIEVANGNGHAQEPSSPSRMGASEAPIFSGPM